MISKKTFTKINKSTSNYIKNVLNKNQLTKSLKTITIISKIIISLRESTGN
jgi:hypothetical protein